jgi:GPH family glycoside/pentoside/hexuronide:cation symporter
VRLSFSIIGGVLAAFLHTQIVSAFDDPIRGHLVSAAIWAVCITLPWFITVAGTREPEYATRAPAPGGPGFVDGLKIALGNRAFLLVSAIYLLSWLAVQFVQSNLVLYARDWIRMDMGLFGYLLLAIQFSSFVWLLFWARASERLGKQNIYYLGITVFILVELALFFVQPNQFLVLFGAAVVAGVGIAVVYLVPWSMVPDVVELDELQTGQRREGIYYGFFAFIQKVGLAVASLIAGWVLETAGYINAVAGQPAPTQPPQALLALRVLVGPVGAAILLLSFIAVRLYPLTRERHAQIRAELQKKR